MKRGLPQDAMHRTGHLVLCVSVTAIAAAVGYGLNAVQFDHLETLWLGRAFTLPVAVALGPVFGVVAAALGALPALRIEPGLLVLFVAEALVLAVATRRRQASLTARGLVVALLATSVALFPNIHGLAGLNVTTLPLAIQRVLVLIIATVASDFLSAALSSLTVKLGWAKPSSLQTPLRGRILHAAILLATLPLLVVNVISGEIFATRHRGEIEARLKDTALTLSDRFNSYMEVQLSGVSAVAASVRGDPHVADAAALLRDFAVIHPDFRTLGLADKTGQVLVRHSVVQAPSGPPSLAGRQFLSEAISVKKITISDVSRSRTNGDEIVFIGAPLLGPDRSVTGMAYGSLQLDAFANFLGPYITLPNSTVVLLDRSNRVIFASKGLTYASGDDLTNSPMVRGADEAPLVSTGTSVVGVSSVYAYQPEDSSAAVQLASRGIIPSTGWTVYVQQPETLLASEVPAYFMVTMGFLLVAIGGSIIGARHFAAAVTGPLEGLASFVSRLSVDSADVVSVPANAPLEVSTLARGVSQMQERLRDSYKQLELAHAAGAAANKNLGNLASTLEATVEKRTADLASTTRFLEHVLRTLPGALFVSDSAGHVRLCNETATALTGRTASDLIGLSMSAVLETDAPLESTTAAKAEQNLVTATGERIPMLVSSACLGSHDQSSDAGAIHIAIDIRDRKQLEMELHQAQKLESVGRLAAGVAHEINTPAQFVSDSVQFLKEGLTDILGLVVQYRELRRAVADGAPATDLAGSIARAEEDADLDYLVENVPSAIDRSIEGLGRVTTIVKSMKEFAHPDQKEMTLIDLNHGIESTLIIARSEYKYVAEVLTDLGQLPPVRCHGGDINQVVLNIVVNAAHAIGDVVADSGRKGRITIRTRLDGDYAVVQIGDTGGGIPEGVRERVFDPFFTTKGVGKGTGQGLAIGRTIIDKHHGQFTFETAMGQGTTFTIRLPIDGPRLLSDVAA